MSFPRLDKIMLKYTSILMDQFLNQETQHLLIGSETDNLLNENAWIHILPNSVPAELSYIPRFIVPPHAGKSFLQSC